MSTEIIKNLSILLLPEDIVAEKEKGVRVKFLYSD
jgi:hypothetical protein